MTTTVTGRALWKERGTAGLYRVFFTQVQGSHRIPTPRRLSKRCPHEVFQNGDLDMSEDLRTPVVRTCSTHQLAVAKPPLGRPGARAAFHPLLFAFCWPGGEHGGVDRKGSLSEILVLQTVFGSDPSGWVVCQEAEKNLGRGWNREEGQKKKKKNSPKVIHSSETQLRIFWFLSKSRKETRLLLLKHFSVLLGYRYNNNLRLRFSSRCWEHNVSNSTARNAKVKCAEFQAPPRVRSPHGITFSRGRSSSTYLFIRSKPWSESSAPNLLRRLL